MKNIIAILSLISVLLLFSFTGNSNKKTNLEEDNLKGHIRKLIEITYSAVNMFGDIRTGEITEKDISDYNEKGNITYFEEHKPNGSLMFNEAFRYDAKDNQIETNSNDIDEKSTYKTTSKYDIEGNKVEEFIYESDSLNCKHIYRYDKYGNLILQNLYTIDGRLADSCTFRYDNEGNELERNSYDSNGKLSFRSVEVYDSIGNVTEQNNYESGVPAMKLTYKYDSYDKTGNWLKKIEYHNGTPDNITLREIEYY